MAVDAATFTPKQHGINPFETMETLFALPVFLALITGVQHFDRKAQATLSPEEKARLSDFNSESSSWIMVPMIVLLLGYGAFDYYRPNGGGVAIGLTVFVVLMTLLTMAYERRFSRRLTTLNLPPSYLGRFRRLRLVRAVGTLIFVGWTLGSTINAINRMEQQMESLKKLSPPKP